MSVIVIDIGSSSIRGILFDDSARPIPDAVVQMPQTFTKNPEGAATLDPLLLKAHVETALDQLLELSTDEPIHAVCMATLVGSVVGVDAHNHPITPIYTYADTQNAEDVDYLSTRVDAKAAHQRTGCRLHTAYLPARLHWLQRTQPEQFERVHRWLDLATYLYSCWFDQSPCSYSVAAWSGLLNRAELTWDTEWLEELNLSMLRLPALIDHDQPQRGLTGDYANRWKALRDVPFFPAVGDGAAANVGSGCVDSSHIALTLGTTGALRTVFHGDAPHLPDGLWGYRISAPLHLVGGATTEGGNIESWLQQTFKFSYGDLHTLLEHAEPDAHGLTVLPLFQGERSPGWNANATATLHGLRMTTTPVQIAQALYESVALRLASIALLLNELITDDAIVVGGGGAIVHNKAWAQLIADALNRPLHITGDSEVTARGTAILALHALGLCDLNAYPPTIREVLDPRPAAAEKMKAARLRQNALYERLYR